MPQEEIQTAREDTDGGTAGRMPPVPRTALMETERLLLRIPGAGDAPFILRLLNEPAFLRFIGDRGVHSLEEAEGYVLRQVPREGEATVLGLRLVVRRDDGAPLGMCGLLRRPWLDAPDLAYAFASEAEGRGYATEAARAVVDDARGRGVADRLLAVVVPENRGSIRVLEKLGFRPDGRAADPSDGRELLRFVLAPDA